MDTEALETFVAVHREQGFSRAARVLHRTQPAISRRISLLEHELGAPLFERVTGGIVLSQAGRVLLPYAERVNSDMFRELSDLVESREQLLHRLAHETPDA